jgi:L-ascorbate metabolism protein UlaG (beta-lactamase superfamily)
MELKLIAAVAVLATSTCVNTVAQETSVEADNGNIRITPLVHSSVQIEYNGLVIQVDPWSVVDLGQSLPADIILISDDIGHHLDTVAIAMLSKPDTEIVMPQSGAVHLADGKVLDNGEYVVSHGVRIESVAAYDIIPGEPSHLKGDANAYLVDLGGKRILLAGVTECVPEILALENVDIAFMPMNIPLGRMTPAAAAECTRALDPEIVYLYHYDQGYAARVNRPDAAPPALPGGLSVLESIEAFRRELEGSGIEFINAEWYPARN